MGLSAHVIFYYWQGPIDFDLDVDNFEMHVVRSAKIMAMFSRSQLFILSTYDLNSTYLMLMLMLSLNMQTVNTPFVRENTSLCSEMHQLNILGQKLSDDLYAIYLWNEWKSQPHERCVIIFSKITDVTRFCFWTINHKVSWPWLSTVVNIIFIELLLKLIWIHAWNVCHLGWITKIWFEY